jgi:hypothetical protein
MFKGSLMMTLRQQFIEEVRSTRLSETLPTISLNVFEGQSL